MQVADKTNVIAYGQLKLYVKETGQELCKKNLVIKNSPHITALSLGGDIINTTVKIASWGDNFIETPIGSYYNMTTLECLEDVHAIDGNHTVKTIAISGHSYPASKAIRFSFQFDRNTASEFIGKNLLEFGLYFNDILYSRVALQEDNYFASWMTVVGEWTIIFMSCSGGYSNYILNQYEISSLWTMDALNSEFQMPDLAGRNNLEGLITPPKLISNLVGIDPNVVESDFIHRDSLCAFYEQSGTPNALRIQTSDIYNNTLDLANKFTLWQWFKFKDINTSPFVLPQGKKWILFSRWVADNTLSQCSYRLYLERSPITSTIDEVELKFDINDGGTKITLSSGALSTHPFHTINILNEWCLAVITYDTNNVFKLYLNGLELDSNVLTNHGTTPINSTSFLIGAQQLTALNSTSVDTTTAFKGFIDETGVSKEAFTASSISMMWNSGFGDFYNP